MQETSQTDSLRISAFLRQQQVLALVPFSATTLWRRCKAGTFPLPVKLSPGISAWRAEEIRAWMASQGVI